MKTIRFLIAIILYFLGIYLALINPLDFYIENEHLTLMQVLKAKDIEIVSGIILRILSRYFFYISEKYE